MSGYIRQIQVSDGEPITPPTTVVVGALSLGVYPSDAAYEAAVGRSGQQGDIYYNSTDHVIRYYKEDEWTVLQGGGGAILVAAFARGTLALPTGSVTIDGYSVMTGDLVCFPDIDNKIYEAIGIGATINSWDVKNLYFDSSELPQAGESVRVQNGDAFGLQLATFDGTDFVVNDIVRYFTEGNFWEQTAIKESSLTDNTTGNVFSVTALQSENMVIDYSLVRGTEKRVGQLYVTHQNIAGAVPITDASADTADLGVTFSAEVSGGNLLLKYTTTATGSGATMKYALKRWSDASGGPSSAPSYSPGGGGTVPASGAVGDIQFHGGDGNLGANSNLAWDDSDQALQLGSLNFSILKQVTLIDNQVDQIIFTIPVVDARHMIMEYSIARGNDSRVGRKIIFADAGGAIAESEDAVEPIATGVTLSSDINGGNIRFKYSSTATGQNATFRYSLRYWS